MSGDNFRTVSAEVSAEVLTQFYAMEETHPRGGRPYDGNDMELRRLQREREAQRYAATWTPERRTNARDRMLARQAERVGLDVSELPLYRHYRWNKHMTAEEAIGAIIRSRKPGR